VVHEVYPSACARTLVHTPRRPGRLAPVSRLALAAILCSLTLLGAACGGGETVEPAPEDVEGTIEEQTVAGGDPEAGKEVFETANPGCGTCHTFEPAGSSAEVGPDLDESLADLDAQEIQQAIVNPDAEVAEGFQPGVMPKDYGEKLSDEQLADLVAFLQSG
jgi:mono/diheme cytochrome c family protein